MRSAMAGLPGEQGAGRLHEALGRIAPAVMLRPERDPQLLEHVHGHGVRAQPDQDAGGLHGHDVGDAHGVVQVGLRIVDDHGPGRGQRLDLGPVDVHGVGGDRLRAEDAGAPQPLDDAQAVPGQAVFLVARGLGAVDVAAHAQVGGQGRGAGERLVREGEGGVQADQRPQVLAAPLAAEAHGVGVLGQPLGGGLARRPGPRSRRPGRCAGRFPCPPGRCAPGSRGSPRGWRGGRSGSSCRWRTAASIMIRAL